MKTQDEKTIIDLMYETIEQTAILTAKAKSESFQKEDNLSDRQRAHKDCGMKESDY
jgi:hypothetical protein